MHVIRKEFDASQTGVFDILTANTNIIIKDIAMLGSGGAAASIKVDYNGKLYQLANTNYIGKRKALIKKGESLKLNIYSIGSTYQV